MSESAPIPTKQGRDAAIESAMHFATKELVFPEIVERYGADRVFEVARTIHERNLVTHGTESEKRGAGNSSGSTGSPSPSRQARAPGSRIATQSGSRPLG